MGGSRHVPYGICFIIAALGAALGFSGDVVLGGIVALIGVVGAYLLSQPAAKETAQRTATADRGSHANGSRWER